MTDLDDRFRSLDLIHPPDLWLDIQTRRSSRGSQPQARQRWAVAALALVVAAAALALAAYALLGSRSTRVDQGPPIRIRPKANGAIAFLAGDQPGGVFGTSHVYRMNPDGTAIKQLTSSDWRDAQLDWSPDGSKIVFVRRGGEFPPSNIMVMNSDGSGTSQLTNPTGQSRLDSSYDIEPTWSPDGRRIAFSRGGVNGNPYEVYVMNADGSGVAKLTHDAGQNGDTAPAWSPDGTQIAFASDRAQRGLNNLYVMNADGSGITRLTDSSAYDDIPRWSPDGRTIAFLELEPNLSFHRIVLIGANGRGRQVIFTCQGTCLSLSAVTWSPDGKEIAFSIEMKGSSRDRPLSAIFTMRPDGTNIRRLMTGSLDACCPAWQAIPRT